MSCVHYKFFSKLSYDTVTFGGLHISLCDLKRRIMGREKLKAANCDLQITNAQTKEEYTDDHALIPKNSSTTNLAEANASEEDKIKAMMMQSCCGYDPTRLKKSTGIPRSFMMEVQDPNTKGAMLTSTGKYAIPTINAEAYARGKKEKPPFSPEEPSSSSSDDPIPDELSCPICKELMTDAAVIPCCGNSFCDECIRTALLDSEEHTCPACYQTDVSPDALIANLFLRKAVNNFKNGTGYTKRLRQQIQEPQQPPPPPPPLLTVTPPAALGYQVPVPRQPALPSLLGPQGQSIPTTGRPMSASTIRSAGGRPGWELPKSPCSASSSSTSLYTYSKSRSGSSRSRSYSRSFSRSPSRSYSRSPLYARRGYFSPDRFGPPGTRRENSPYARGRRQDYPGGQSHQKCNTAGNYPGKTSGRERHGIKDPTKSKEKEVEHRLGGDKGNKDKKHRKRRKGDENGGFPNAEWLEGMRKPREPLTAEDVKMDSLFMLPSRDDATPVRGEPMEAGSMAFKAAPEKEKKEKDRPEAKTDKTKRKVEVAVPPKTDNIRKPAKASQEKVNTDGDKSPPMEPAVKKVKEEQPTLMRFCS
ncbi:E3 ubiquitin-protein ligase RBBP6-like [Gavia stellata]|uniref:E3 ubiquitin-protein ligase RBBP6-like n=1 Tax=Gavia stellata TaxID=37040 RepID=UPI00289F13D9|nr:E3 ubiquitin-protein ligase RBBP6-like [Gavia stellata]